MKDPISLILSFFFKKEFNPRNSLVFSHMMDTTHNNWHTRLINNSQIEKYQYNLYSK
jgi:dynactin complex subunit